MLIEHAHEIHCHTLARIAILRENYWILNRQNKVRHLIRKCIKCLRIKPTTESYKLGDLPKNRVAISRPIVKCRVDYAGPIFIKQALISKQRVKVCIAVCINEDKGSSY